MTTRPLWEKKIRKDLSAYEAMMMFQLIGYFGGRNQPVSDNKKNWIK